MSTWNYKKLIFFILSYFYFFISSVHIFAEKNSSKVYLNQYAVHIHGGRLVAEDLAKLYGFSFIQPIGGLDDYYVFEHPHVHKRSIEPSHTHTELIRHPNVMWFEQQYEKKRVKRDFLERPYRAPSEPNFNDPLYKNQWYLHGGAQGNYDMNVINAWHKGYSGKNVVISILDDGIQHDHPDLIDNYDPKASADINDNDNDPMPRDDGNNKHGTRCAGEVAAMASNNVCGVGVAFKSKIGGVRMLDGPVSDVVEAQALGLNLDHIDIYSASWGPEDDGKTVDGPGPLAKQAFINGITKGRKGKGAIYVWASGNGGLHKDSCNCDGYTNSIYTLSISSATERGLKPWYLEECASTMATTYSSGDSGIDRSVVTTDMSTSGRNLCTEQHTGTSASAPLAGGIVALVLEARPDLTWRDIQYLVVLTSRSIPLEHEDGWMVNAMGRKVSYKFGYGLMDASALVDLAERWVTLPPQHICETKVDSKEKEIGGKLTVTMTTNGCIDSTNAVKYLEHVQAKVTLRFPRRGDIKITLVSPMGTSSVLLPPRPSDILHDELTNWPLLSVHFWGENPNGEWKLIIEDAGNFKRSGYFLQFPGFVGLLQKWSMTFYGTETDPLSHMIEDSTSTRKDTIHTAHAQDLPTYSNHNQEHHSDRKNALKDNRGEVSFNPSDDEQCHDECENDDCTGPGANQCSTCKHFLYLKECVLDCPNYFYAQDSYRCKPCHPSCLTCSGPAETDCESCKQEYSIKDGKCKEQCDEGHYLENYECNPCSTSSCTHCPDNECQACKPGYYLENNRCLACHYNCFTCIGPAEKDCVLCKSDKFKQEHLCVLQCNENYYLSGMECERCHESCKTCNGPSSKHCIYCLPGFFLDENSSCQRKQTHCQSNEFLDRQGRCKPCFPTCASCAGAEESDCIRCDTGHFLLNGQCTPLTVEDKSEEIDHSWNCLKNQFWNPLVKNCENCHNSCFTCKGGSFSDCLTCGVNEQRANLGVCDLSICSANEKYYDSKSKSCQPCYKLCKTCSGPSPNQCLSCKSKAKLHPATKLCLPCCSQSITTNCCQCSDSNGDLCRTPINVKKSVVISMAGYSSQEIVIEHHDSHLQILSQSMTNTVLAITIFSCIFIIILFFIIFGTLQARSNRKWCWQRGYESLPFKYDATAEGIALTKEDLEEDELFSR